MALSIPNGIFSRSSESHNQDKISLGMSAANQCSDLTQKLLSIFSCYLICLAQAIDLRGITLKGNTSSQLYKIIRNEVPFIRKDIQLDHMVSELKNKLMELAINGNVLFEDEDLL